MNITEMTPNLYVNEIEPCLPFWMDRLGFQKVAEVPVEGKLVFVLLQKDNLKVMYGTYASLAENPALKDVVQGPSFLYLTVTNIDDVVTAMQGADVVAPVYDTFYGARETSVRDPAGHVITFAQFIR